MHLAGRRSVAASPAHPRSQDLLETVGRLALQSCATFLQRVVKGG